MVLAALRWLCSERIFRPSPRGSSVLRPRLLEFSQLDPSDLGAIYTFLRTQKPVYHAVDSHPDVHKLVTEK